MWKMKTVFTWFKKKKGENCPFFLSFLTSTYTACIKIRRKPDSLEWKKRHCRKLQCNLLFIVFIDTSLHLQSTCLLPRIETSDWMASSFHIQSAEEKKKRNHSLMKTQQHYNVWVWQSSHPPRLIRHARGGCSTGELVDSEINDGLMSLTYLMKLMHECLHNLTADTAALGYRSPRGSSCAQAAPAGKTQSRLSLTKLVCL